MHMERKSEVMAKDNFDQETEHLDPSTRTLVGKTCAEPEANDVQSISNSPAFLTPMNPCSMDINKSVADLQLDEANSPISPDAAVTNQSEIISRLIRDSTTRDETSLDQLPAEILIKIAKFTDFTSLYALIKTSRRLSSIFDNNTLAIVEHVLDWSSSIPDVLRSYMRAIIHLQTGGFRYKTLDHGNYSNKHSANQFPLKLYNSPQDGSLREATPILLRKFVTLAHQNHILAHDVMDKCLKNCDANDLSWSSSSLEKPTILLPTPQRRFPGHIVPPSAKEERQAVLGIWLAQYFHEVRTAAMNGEFTRATWRPASKNMVYLRSVDTALSDGVALKFWGDYLDELVHTVHHILTDTKTFSLPRPSGGLDQFHLGCDRTPVNTETAMRKFRNYIPIPNDGYQEWKKTFDRFDDPWWEYNANSNFRAFRGLGFAFWDESRMEAYGLSKPTRKAGGPRVTRDEKKANYERWERLAQWDETRYHSMRRQFGARY